MTSYKSSELKFKICVGFEVLTAVVMKSSIVWDVTQFSPLKVNRRFGGTYRPPSSASKNKQSKKPT
jgi:hypothetical protein